MGSRVFKIERSNPKANLYVMMLSGAIWTPISTAMGIYWQIYLMMLGASPLEIAMIAMSSMLVLSVARILGGYLADIIGRRKLIVSMTYLVSLCYLAMFFASTWKIILLVSIFLNLFLLYQPATEAIIADSTSDNARGKNYGVLNLVPSILILFSPIIAYLFISRHGVIGGTRILILLTAMAGFVVGILRTLTLRETIKTQRINKAKSRRFLSQYNDALRIINQKMFALFIFVMLLGVVGGLMVMTQLYVITYLGVSYDLWAMLRFVYLLTFALFVVPAGIATDKYGRKNMLIISTILLLLSTTFLVCASIKPLETLLFAYVIVGSISWAIMSCSIPSLEADVLPKEVRGKAYAVIATANSITQAIFQLICGYIYEAYGETIPQILALFFIIIMLIVALKVKT